VSLRSERNSNLALFPARDDHDREKRTRWTRRYALLSLYLSQLTPPPFLGHFTDPPSFALVQAHKAGRPFRRTRTRASLPSPSPISIWCALLGRSRVLMLVSRCLRPWKLSSGEEEPCQEEGRGSSHRHWTTRSLAPCSSLPPSVNPGRSLGWLGSKSDTPLWFTKGMPFHAIFLLACRLFVSPALHRDAIPSVSDPSVDLLLFPLIVRSYLRAKQRSLSDQSCSFTLALVTARPSCIPAFAGTSADFSFLCPLRCRYVSTFES
jgi:hypothetical protein